MALDRQIARLAKILVDSENISFDEAQAKLRALTMEIVVGRDAASPAAHAAILTAASVASRTFVGGVRVTGAVDGFVNSALPLRAGSLAEAAAVVGASGFKGTSSQRIFVGANPAAEGGCSVSPWWQGWSAGTAETGESCCDVGDNPLPGIAAGALAVGVAFDVERQRCGELRREVGLWPVADTEAPNFAEVFLPGALWLIGLGNLGQAFLWTLAALPYKNPSDVSLVVQDREEVTEENWGTSVLVKEEAYGILKTKVAEGWASDKGFDLRRLDCRLLGSDRLHNDDPRLALSGVDKIEVRKLMATVGFDCIVDAGLGRTASDFDKYRVTVFDRVRSIDKHFVGQTDIPPRVDAPDGEPYHQLASEVGLCGAAEIGGASVAAPYVSAFAAAIAVSRTIAVASGCDCPINEVGRLSLRQCQKIGPLRKVEARGICHSGRPELGARW